MQFFSCRSSGVHEYSDTESSKAGFVASVPATQALNSRCSSNPVAVLSDSMPVLALSLTSTPFRLPPTSSNERHPSLTAMNPLV